MYGRFNLFKIVIVFDLTRFLIFNYALCLLLRLRRLRIGIIPFLIEEGHLVDIWTWHCLLAAELLTNFS